MLASNSLAGGGLETGARLYLLYVHTSAGNVLLDHLPAHSRCVALRCVALRCVALRCVALRCVALRCILGSKQCLYQPLECLGEARTMRLSMKGKKEGYFVEAQDMGIPSGQYQF